MDCIINSCEDAKTKQLQHILISVGRVSVSAIEWLSVDESDKQCVLTAKHS